METRKFSNVWYGCKTGLVVFDTIVFRSTELEILSDVKLPYNHTGHVAYIIINTCF